MARKTAPKAPTPKDDDGPARGPFASVGFRASAVVAPGDFSNIARRGSPAQDGGMTRDRRFATSTEVAKLLGVTPTAAWRAMRAGRIPCLSVGRRLYADLVRLDSVIAEQTAERQKRSGGER